MEPVTFTRVTQSHDATTGRTTPSETTIPGAALGLSAESAFRTFGLIAADEVTLLFITQTLGDRVKPGDRCAWASEQYQVKRVSTFMPDGYDLVGRVLIGK